MSNPAVLRGDFDKVPLFSGNKIMQYGRETNVVKALGYKEELGERGERKVVDGEIYTFLTFLNLNFYGMIAKIEIGMPKKYENVLVSYCRNKLGFKNFELDSSWYSWGRYDYTINIEQYKGLISWLKKEGPFKEIVRIHLYTRDVRLKKIKDVEIRGTFAYKKSYSRLYNEEMNQVKITKNGDAILTLGILKNNATLDYFFVIEDSRLNGFYKPDEYNFFAPYKYSIEESFKDIRALKKVVPYLYFPKPYTITISAEELRKAGVRAQDLKRVWKRAKLLHGRKNSSLREIREKLAYMVKRTLTEKNYLNLDKKGDYYYDIELFLTTFNKTGIYYALVYVNDNGVRHSYFLLLNSKYQVFYLRKYNKTVVLEDIELLDGSEILGRYNSFTVFKGVNYEY
ncbi:MAG: hypothetical protein GXO93_05720 [FCB group bacterium]|nr:hypothetical protein [FCB group bacterium]